jgi:Iron-containing redox enzyme
MPTLPEPRGPLSENLLSVLPGPPRALPTDVADPTFEDLQLALYCCYELHYRGFDGVDDAWEWDPRLLAFRAALERHFAADVEALAGPVPDAPAEMDVALRELMHADDAPSVSTFIEREASLEQVLEFMIHRSAYQLKEADPHAWAIPRLHGAPKAALIEILADEYGGGQPEHVHATLFARAMEAVGLNSAYGFYLDRIPGVTLATVNLMSYFGLHRRLRGAIAGHLALFEMTSCIPNRRYGAGVRRLGYDSEAATAFFDVHVVADAVHEAIAAVDLGGGLGREAPELGAHVLWGARALAAVDARWSHHMIDSWSTGASSLRDPALTPS